MTGLLSYSGMGLYVSVLQRVLAMCSVSTLGEYKGQKRAEDKVAHRVLGCSQSETQELIFSERKATILRVYTFIQYV